MARKGKNKTGSKSNNTFVRNKPKFKAIVKDMPELKSKNIIRSAHRATFFASGKEWPGLQIENVKDNGLYTEFNYYLDEIEDKVLYEETFRKMLKDLETKNEITWYEFIKQVVPWNSEEEFLKLRVK